MSVKLKDIVKETGLSMSTVSNVLNGRPGFSASTQQRVHQVARELGYMPNHLSRALAGGASMSIGLMGVTLKTPVRLVQIRQIEKLAKADNYHIYLVANEGLMSEADLQQTIEDLLARRVDGLIICDLLQLPEPVMDTLKNCGKPVVFMEYLPQDVSFGVKMDNTQAVRDAMTHLRELGHKSVFYLGARFDQLVPQLKLDLYRQEAAFAGLELIESPAWYLEACGVRDDFSGAAYELTRQVLQYVRPSAIACISDETAIGAISAIVQAGLSVPGDISVIGFDDWQISRFINPALTTISQPVQQSGQLAYEILSGLFKHPDTPQDIRRLDCRFVPRASTGPASPQATSASNLKKSLQSHQPIRIGQATQSSGYDHEQAT
jgi:DNA-binding LacI/PurR family transcriptional regulator